MIESALPADAIENTAAIDPIEPIDRHEPTEPIDNTDPLEPTDRIEFSDQSERIEFCDGRMCPDVNRLLIARPLRLGVRALDVAVALATTARATPRNVGE